MTRKVGASRPPITPQGRALKASSRQDAVIDRDNVADVIDLSDNEEEPEYNMINHADVPMHHFGEYSEDPANYRNALPLREEFHFTDATETLEHLIPGELNDFIRDEFMFNDVFGHLAESYTATSSSATPFSAENDSEPYEEAIDQISEWPPRPTLVTGPVYHHERFQTSPFQPPAANFSQPSTFRSAVPTPALAIRSKLPYIQPRPVTLGSGIRALPDGLDADDRENVKGRRRPLSPNARGKTSKIRAMGACARCHKKKEPCDEQRPCRPCMSTAKRSLDFFCMTELPEDRHVHFFTDHLYGHLTIKNGRLGNTNPAPTAEIGPHNRPFRLRLHQYFDTPELQIPVVQFKPQSHDDIHKLVFPIALDGSKYVVTADEILSPPLVPFLSQEQLPVYSEQFNRAVYQWLNCADKNDEIEWHNEFFRVEYGKKWPRGILQDVCLFYHTVMRGGSRHLRSALQSTILVYMIGHSFYVPEEDIKQVLERTGLSEHWDGKEFIFVSPIYVNRFIKVLLYQVLKATVRLALKSYQDLCSPNKHSLLDRDLIMAVSLVLLMVAGSIQSKAIEKAIASERRNGRISRSEYYAKIKEIEDWIIELICDIWVYKFSNSGKVRPNDDPAERLKIYKAKRFDLRERFRVSYRDHAAALDSLSTDLPSENEINYETFGTTNIDRIMKKFYNCVFHPQNETHRPVSRGTSSRERY